MDNHHKGIHPGKSVKNEGLISFFRITSTNLDLDMRKQFVSTIEWIQFIPHLWCTTPSGKKNDFEYRTQLGSTIQTYEAISHTEEAVLTLSIHLATFFVNKGRWSTIGEESYTIGQRRHLAITTYPVGRSKGFLGQVFIQPAPVEHY